MWAAACLLKPRPLDVLCDDINSLQDAHGVRLSTCRLTIRQDDTIEPSQAPLNHRSSEAGRRGVFVGGSKEGSGGVDRKICYNLMLNDASPLLRVSMNDPVLKPRTPGRFRFYSSSCCFFASHSFHRTRSATYTKVQTREYLDVGQDAIYETTNTDTAVD